MCHLVAASDITKLYKIGINEVVKRNIERLKLTKEECDEIYLRSQIATLNINNNKRGYMSIIYNNSFHDRYLIIDKKIIYHCGTSINKAGAKTFSINRLKDEKVTNSLLSEINKIIKRSDEI